MMGSYETESLVVVHADARRIVHSAPGMSDVRRNRWYKA